MLQDSSKRKPPAAGMGRPKGAVNKSTRNAREAIGMLVENNVERMQGWLDEIAAEQGAQAAWRCMQDVIEYHVPRLARTEHVGENGGPVRIIATSEDEKL